MHLEKCMELVCRVDIGGTLTVLYLFGIGQRHCAACGNSVVRGSRLIGLRVEPYYRRSTGSREILMLLVRNLG